MKKKIGFSSLVIIVIIVFGFILRSKTTNAGDLYCVTWYGDVEQCCFSGGGNCNYYDIGDLKGPFMKSKPARPTN